MEKPLGKTHLSGLSGDGGGAKLVGSAESARYPPHFKEWPGMIDPLKSDDVIRQVGGRFKLTALVQHRWRELMDGARPLVPREGRSDLELAIQEIVEEKIAIDYEQSDLRQPDATQT